MLASLSLRSIFSDSKSLTISRAVLISLHVEPKFWMESDKLRADNCKGEIKLALNDLIDLVMPFPEFLNSSATNVKEISNKTAKTVLIRAESLTAK